MKTKVTLLLLVGCLLCLVVPSKAQILTVTPTFPTVNDSITIVYDATLGNAALVGVTQLYAHTGLITENSPTAGAWQHIQGNWGTDDLKVKMTYIGNNKHQIRLRIKNFYQVPDGEDVYKMAFVFRDKTGANVGRATDGSDIFYDVNNNTQALLASITTPENDQLLELDDTLRVKATVSADATITLYDNGTVLSTLQGTTINYLIQAQTYGNHKVVLEANNGTSIARDSFYYVVRQELAPLAQPANTNPGATYVSNTALRFSLYAPGKGHVFLIGDFTDWKIDAGYQMRKTPDGATFWIDVPNLQQGKEYAYQYLIDGSLRVADPYSEKILTSYDDNEIIQEGTYPNLKPYPQGKTSGNVTAVTPGKTPFNWQVPVFYKPWKEDLVIHETLLRDFIKKHDYKTMLDTLDFFQKSGVNCIQLMPVAEFEGNNSWGYNVSHHMALDKYYGSADDFKRFIDACHQRGIAVIVDVVYNHAFSQCPLAQMYWDPVNDRPASNNPWFNVIPTHPYNVGSDFNHASQGTKDYVKYTLKYWLTEFKIDGFRFDLTKGFTQTNTGNDVGAWGAYDQSRIDILKDYSSYIWSIEPYAYVTFEHLSDNNEEKVLQDHGIMLWGNLNHQYNEATMGYSADLSWGSWQARGWTKPHLITYMESHDEERLNYKNINYGNSNASNGYNIKNLPTALKRMELAGVFFFTIPGPKMLWQFGDLGYDYSINYCSATDTVLAECRQDRRPIRWDYLYDANRQHLHKVWAALAKLKTSQTDLFRTYDYYMATSAPTKRILLESPNMNGLALGNFNVVQSSISPGFPHTGKWYEYFSGDSLSVSDVYANIALQPGEYRLYFDKKLPLPDLSYTPANTSGVALVAPTPKLNLNAYPNPTYGNLILTYSLPNEYQVNIEIYNLYGQRVQTLVPTQRLQDGDYMENIQLHNDLPSGTYFVRIQADSIIETQKIFVIR